MASYGKQKYCGPSSRRVRRRPVRRTSRFKKVVAKKRYSRKRSCSFKRIPRPIISNGRLPSHAFGSFVATYVIDATLFTDYRFRANFIQTGAS
eukprot:4528788-Pleurochrysis_carterae.AAC.1